MANIRVHELATELRKSNREVSDRLHKLGIPARTNLSSIKPDDANRVRVSFGRDPLPIEKPKKTARKPAAKKPAAKKPAAKKAPKKPAAKKAATKKAAAKKTAARKPAAKKAAAKKPAAGKAEVETAAGKAEKVEASRRVEERPAATVETAKKAAAPSAPPADKAVPPARKADLAAAPAPARPPAREAAPPGEAAASAVEKAVPRKAEAPARPEAGKPAARAGAPRPAAKPGAAKPALRPGAPRPAGKAPAGPPRGKKPLRVAPPDRRTAPRKAAPGDRKVYRFVPKGRHAPARTKGAPSTVAPKLLRVSSGVTVKEFAQIAGLTPGDVIKRIMSFGEMLTLNQSINDDALKLLSEQLGIEIKIKPQRIEEFEELVDEPGELKHRPPVVTVMGHVDHGKTRLLDTIRKTDVASGEMGGITQHIGAYQVLFDNRPITFIDTPGHESFTSMRARGAQATDLVVLVVAADDGVMPQTIEALDHATEAQVPIIVAVNKVDKPDADAPRVRQQLSERGLIPEEWGGETVFVDVSAKDGTNIDHLLEMILLVSEMLELKANPDAPASGVVVEAKLDKARGNSVTVLVQRGTARVGDVVAVGTAWGKIRAIFDDRGDPAETAVPAQPVELLGLSSLPMAGDEFRVVDDEKKARQIVDRRRMHKKLEEQAGPRHVSLENLFDRIKEGEINQLKFVLKADTQGSLEAVADSLEKLSRDEVKLNAIHTGVGGITETDIMLASASDAVVIGFNVRPDVKAVRAAEAEEVEIRTYQVIYKLTEEMEAALIGMLAPEYEEERLGAVEVRQTFRVPGIGMVAGSYVTDGTVARNALARVVRDGVVIYDGKISSLRRFKDDVKNVATGFECGIGLEDFNDVKEGDVIEAYQMREIPR